MESKTLEARTDADRRDMSSISIMFLYDIGDVTWNQYPNGNIAILRHELGDPDVMSASQIPTDIGICSKYMYSYEKNLPEISAVLLELY